MQNVSSGVCTFWVITHAVEQACPLTSENMTALLIMSPSLCFDFMTALIPKIDPSLRRSVANGLGVIVFHTAPLHTLRILPPSPLPPHIERTAPSTALTPRLSSSCRRFKTHAPLSSFSADSATPRTHTYVDERWLTQPCLWYSAAATGFEVTSQIRSLRMKYGKSIFFFAYCPILPPD